MRHVKVWANYYQQFSADYTLDVPAEGYGGWKRAELSLDLGRTAIALMHAWDCGTYEEYPGWYRAVEYIPRANAITQTVLPGLLAAARAAGVNVFHVVGGGNYYHGYPGYERAKRLAGPEPPQPERIEADPVLRELWRFRSAHVFPGTENLADIARGSPRRDFPPEARPVGDEAVAENSRQLFALCQEAGVNHLIYAGFAINWCLLLSPGGMAEMSKHGIMCSAFRQAVTAVENRETARQELAKELGLWRVALAFGFVFDVDDFVAALR